MHSSEQIDETTLRDYWRVFFRQKWVVVTTIVTVCATVFIGLKLKTRIYESSVKMLITAEKQVEAPYYREIYAGARNVQQTLTQSEIVRSNPVLVRAVRALALDKRPLDDEKQFSSPLKARLIDYNVQAFARKMEGLPQAQREAFLFRRAVESLRESIRVEPVRDTNMFTITVRDYNPVGAAIIANVVSRSYVIFDLEQQLAELKLKYGEKHPTVNLVEENIATLQTTLTGGPMDDVEAIGPASVKIIEQASVPLEPDGMPEAFTFSLAVMMSVFLSVMLAFVFEYADQTFKSPQDIERFLNLPLLGSVPRRKIFDRVLIDPRRGESLRARLYQILSDQIYLLTRDKRVKTLLVTSVSAKDGSASITANIGLYFAGRLRHKVLIIDAGLRNAGLHKIFKSPQEPGLASVLEGRDALDAVVQKKDSNLHLIFAGRTALNPLTLLDSARMAEVLKKAKEKYEVVLILCENLGNFKDAVVLSSQVDGVVLVVNEGAVRRQVIQNALASLDRAGGGAKSSPPVLGVVLNNRTFPIPKMVYERV